MKIHNRGIMAFFGMLIIVLSMGVTGSIEGAEDHLWSTILAAFMIALAAGYLVNKTVEVPEKFIEEKKHD